MVVDPADGLVDEVRGQVIAGFWRGRIFDRAGIVIEMRFPLVVVSGQKSIEMVETQGGRPMVERPGRTDFPCRGIVPFAESRRGIAVQLQDAGEARGFLFPDAVIGRNPAATLVRLPNPTS
jgi:hypothetical protein